MDYNKIARTIFLISAVYDFLLGVLFFFFYNQIFNFFSIPIPNFPEYLQMSSAFVVALGVGYFFIYLNIERNKDLYKVGILYKAVYIFLVAYYYFITKTANTIFFNFALIDAVFLILFLALYRKVYAK